MKQKAFTLAEVLIALMIIGVLAVVTLPALTKAWEKRALKTELTQTYSELLRVNQMFIAKEGMSMYEYSVVMNILPSYVGQPSPKVLVSKLRDYIKIISPTSLDVGETYSRYLARDNYKTLNDNTIACAYFDDGYFKDNRGRDWFFEYSVPFVSIDINGVGKGSNKWGYDIFTFDIKKDGTIEPIKNSGVCSYSSAHSMNGEGCAYYAVKNISPDDATKTYWNDFLK